MKVLITGGTGYLGRALTRHLLQLPETTGIRIYSRGEAAQARMASEIHDERMRYLVGDVRDRDRLERAMEYIRSLLAADQQRSASSEVCSSRASKVLRTPSANCRSHSVCRSATAESQITESTTVSSPVAMPDHATARPRSAPPDDLMRSSAIIPSRIANAPESPAPQQTSGSDTPPIAADAIASRLSAGRPPVRGVVVGASSLSSIDPRYSRSRAERWLAACNPDRRPAACNHDRRPAA